MKSVSPLLWLLIASRWLIIWKMLPTHVTLTTEVEMVPVVRCNIYSLVYRSRTAQRVPWNHVIQEAWSLYDKSELTGEGPRLLSMLQRTLPLWRGLSRAPWQHFSFCGGKGGKGRSVMWRHHGSHFYKVRYILGVGQALVLLSLR